MSIIVYMPALLTATSSGKDILPSPMRAAWNAVAAELYVIRELLNGSSPDLDSAYAMNMDRVN